MSDISPMGYEKRDVNLPKVVIYTLVPAVLIIVCLIGLDQAMKLTTESMYYKRVLDVEDVQYKELIQGQMQVQNNYKVLDAKKGVVQIPISRAKQLIVQEGQTN